MAAERPAPQLVYPANARPLEELPATIGKAIRNILACDSPKKRRERFPIVCRRKRRGTRAEPIRRKQGSYEERDLEVCERNRRDHFVVAVLQKTIWDLAHCDLLTGQTGDFRGGKIHYLSRCVMAEGAGFPVRIDDQRRIRAYQLDHVVEHQVAWGLVFRHQEAEGRPLKHVIRDGAWARFGAAISRQRAIARAKKKAREAERERARGPGGDLRGQEWPAEVKAIVGALARSRTNDTDPYADRVPPVPRPKPPST